MTMLIATFLTDLIFELSNQTKLLNHLVFTNLNQIEIKNHEKGKTKQPKISIQYSLVQGKPNQISNTILIYYNTLYLY